MTGAPAYEAYVDYTFEWTHTARKSVLLSGSYDNWLTRTPLEAVRRDGAVVYQLRKRLPARDYQYKFIVDDEWLVDQDKPVAKDPHGNDNNVLYGAFILGATVARELHSKAFVCTTQADTAEGRAKKTHYLAFQRYPAQCEAQYPWHGEWSLAENSPAHVVQSGRWAVELRGTQRVVTFEPALAGIGSTTATYDPSVLAVTVAATPEPVVFARVLS